jgi:hypothetical protein
MADMFDKEELGIVGSLFGTTPEALQLARENTAYTRGTNAGTNLLGGILGQSGMFAERGAAGLRGALGQQTQDEQMLSMRKQAQQQFDTNTPEGLYQMAQFLNKSGDAAGARQAILLAQGQQQAGATLAKTQAEEKAKLREPLPTIAKLQAYRTNLISQFGANDPRVKEVDAEIAGLAKQGQTNIDLGGLTSLFAKKETEASAKEITDQIASAEKALQTGSKISRDIAEIEKLIPNSYQGQFANLSKTFSKTLAGLGVPVSDKASNTEVIQALTNNLVLPAVKQLPGSLAAKELDFLKQSKPGSEQELASFKRLINLLKDDISVNRALVKRADKYKKEDKLGSLQGFNIALQQDNIYTDLRKYNTLKDKVAKGQKVTADEATFAKSIEEELGL